MNFIVPEAWIGVNARMFSYFPKPYFLGFLSRFLGRRRFLALSSRSQ